MVQCRDACQNLKTDVFSCFSTEPIHEKQGTKNETVTNNRMKQNARKTTNTKQKITNTVQGTKTELETVIKIIPITENVIFKRGKLSY